MKIQEYFNRMNQRERILAGLVVGVLFLLINFFGWSWLMGAITRSHADLAAHRQARLEETVFLKERELWKKRQQWVDQHQPVYKGAGEASSLLEDQIKPVAARHTMLIENPQISAGESTPNYQSVHASFDTKSSWESLVRFLYDVQQPESFIVFESVNLAIDPGDQSQMRGKFKVARWFAPAGGAKK